MTAAVVGGEVARDDDRAAAFTEWVRPHLTAMAALATRLTSYDDRDDVVQEALVRAWRRWSTYDETKGQPLPWLLAITADRARRKRRKAPELSIDTARLDAYADVDLERAIARLAPRQRLAVDLYYFVGLDVGTVSEVMACSAGTVKSTLADARARLRDLLEETT
ncbi:MAG: RNA polymerase sigma factor [Actinomycetes bacterium]